MFGKKQLAAKQHLNGADGLKIEVSAIRGQNLIRPHSMTVKVSKSGTQWMQKRICDYGYDLNGGRWTYQEEELYAAFLQKHKGEFESAHSRRTKKVFERLSQALGRQRSSQQCRSHHQKMQKKINSSKVDAIVHQIRDRAEAKRRKEKKEIEKQEMIRSTRSESCTLNMQLMEQGPSHRVYQSKNTADCPYSTHTNTFLVIIELEMLPGF